MVLWLKSVQIKVVLLLDALDLEAASGGQAQKALAKIAYAVDGQREHYHRLKK